MQMALLPLMVKHIEHSKFIEPLSKSGSNKPIKGE